jgi:hypothetical protein
MRAKKPAPPSRKNSRAWLFRTQKRAQVKTVIMVYILVLLTSVASAGVYRWEDSNGLHFTDDSSSLPEKYREKDLAENETQQGNTTRQVSVGMTRQGSPDANQDNHAAVHQANLEQHRLTAAAKKQQQLDRKDFDTTMQLLSKFIVIWMILGFFLFVVWIGTIVDIIRSGFVKPSYKTIWMLLVLLLPLLGMMFYMILGSHQKCNSVNNREKQRLEEFWGHSNSIRNS